MSSQSPQSIGGVVFRGREWLRGSRYLEIAVFVFIAGFFLATDTRLHRDIYYFAVLIPFLSLIDWKSLVLLSETSVFRATIAFIAFLLVTMLWSPNVDIVAVYDRLRYALLIISFILIVSYLSFRDVAWSDRLTVWLIPVGSVTLILSALMFYGDGGNFPGDRLENMLFYRENPLRGSLAFGFLAVLCGASLIQVRSSKIKIALVAVGLSVSLIFLLLAQSRGHLLGVAVAMVVTVIACRQWRLLISLACFSVLIVAFTQFDAIGIRGFIDRGDSHRMELWSATLDQAMTAPWFGQGLNVDLVFQLENGTAIYSTHNIWLTVFLIGGVCGIIFLLVLVYQALRGAIIHGKNCSNWLPLTLLIFGLVHTALNANQPVHRMDPDFWLALWVPIALVIAAEARSRRIGDGGQAEHEGCPKGGVCREC